VCKIKAFDETEGFEWLHNMLWDELVVRWLENKSWLESCNMRVSEQLYTCMRNILVRLKKMCPPVRQPPHM
jgi:hypothetical protein